MRTRRIHMHTARILILTLILTLIRMLMVTVIPGTMEATTATHTVTDIGAVEGTGAAGVITAVVATLDVVMLDADMRVVALEAAAR
jgi:hypothetical protein